LSAITYLYNGNANELLNPKFITTSCDNDDDDDDGVRVCMRCSLRLDFSRSAHSMVHALLVRFIHFHEML